MISSNTSRGTVLADRLLADYRRKRDFSKTPEPQPKSGKPHKHPIFVVQEHHARRLHYDLRLEADGVLKSWAVTKVPTMDPAVRRLAVRTDDHPLEYANFEGDIPEGQYGAGHVQIWDRGTYENLSAKPLSDALKAGKIEVELHGKKLKGKFALIRMRNGGRRENWLLIKMKDQFACSASNHGRSNRALSPRSNGAASRTLPALLPALVRRLPFKLTNLDKVMFPEKGYTKGDVLDYYAAVARLLLPHLRDRPITLERLPDGVRRGAPHFWQKRTPSYYPDWIPRFETVSKDGKLVNYPLVNDERALLYMVNQGTLTFHPWLSRIEDVDHPDFVLFDLDLGKSTAFADLTNIAKELHRELDAEHVDNFVKTSGKTGVHVLAPWTEPGGYDDARAWAFSIAQRVTETLPNIATIERRKSARHGKAYVDVMQNAKGHHVVPPYVLRAVPSAAVSTPLKWTELTSRLTPERFDLKTAPKRFEREKEDPMEPLVTFSALKRRRRRRRT
jgi:bifunctional non-homologous end joining protein LigD